MPCPLFVHWTRQCCPKGKSVLLCGVPVSNPKQLCELSTTERNSDCDAKRAPDSNQCLDALSEPGLFLAVIMSGIGRTGIVFHSHTVHMQTLTIMAMMYCGGAVACG